MLKAILIDDEAKALESLAWELDNFVKEIEVLKKFTSPEEALEFLKQNNVDCIFLDIEMPTMDGFQFLNKLNNKEVAVVITTAYNEYAIQAIKQKAIDYLLKPVDIDDLTATVSRIKEHVYQSDAVSEKLEYILDNYKTKVNEKKITIQTDGRLIFLNVEDIVFAESDGNYSTIYLSDSKKIVLTKKLKEVNELMPEEYFFRIHNSYIVNLNKIKEYIKSDSYVVLEGNHKIPISRQKRKDFLNKF